MTQNTAENSAGDIDSAMNRVKQLSDEVLAQAKQNGLAGLESYERMLKNLLDFEEQVAKGTGVEFASQLATIHANFVRETSEVIFGSLRSQMNR